jgi:hypothetical protein
MMINSKTTARAFAAMVLVTTAAVGCAQPVEEETVERPLPDGVSTAARADIKVIATLDVASTGGTVTLHEIDGEEVGMLEEMPLGAVSILDRLVGEQQATALEVFSALTRSGVTAPESLRRAHERSAGAKAARVLVLPESNAPGIAPRGFTNHNVQIAECTLASDGQTFFDTFWQSLGWDYHWYNIHPEYTSAGFVGSGITPNASTYRAHACNGGKKDNPSAKLAFSVVRQGGGACVEKVLLDGYLLSKDRRSVWYQSGAPVCHYRGWVEPQGTLGKPHRWAMGITAP